MYSKATFTEVARRYFSTHKYEIVAEPIGSTIDLILSAPDTYCLVMVHVQGSNTATLPKEESQSIRIALECDAFRWLLNNPGEYLGYSVRFDNVCIATEWPNETAFIRHHEDCLGEMPIVDGMAI